jgi:hypothetical protein
LKEKFDFKSLDRQLVAAIVRYRLKAAADERPLDKGVRLATGRDGQPLSRYRVTSRDSAAKAKPHIECRNNNMPKYHAPERLEVALTR